MESTERSFCRRGRGRSVHIHRPGTEKVREPTEESLVREIWTLRALEAERGKYACVLHVNDTQMLTPLANASNVPDLVQKPRDRWDYSNDQD